MIKEPHLWYKELIPAKQSCQLLATDYKSAYLYIINIITVPKRQEQAVGKTKDKL
jgi:hypothetical protein